MKRAGSSDESDGPAFVRHAEGYLPFDFFVYWLIPSGLLLRRCDVLLSLLQALPRDVLLWLLLCDERLFFVPDLVSETFELPDVFVLDSFIR